MLPSIKRRRTSVKALQSAELHNDPEGRRSGCRLSPLLTMAQELGRALATRPFAVHAARRSSVEDLVSAFLAGSDGEADKPAARKARGGKCLNGVATEVFVLGRMVRHVPQLREAVADQGPRRSLRLNIHKGFAQEWGRAQLAFGSTPVNLTCEQRPYPDTPEHTYQSGYTARTRFDTDMDLALFGRTKTYMRRVKAIFRSMDPTVLVDVGLPPSQRPEYGTIFSTHDLRMWLLTNPYRAGAQAPARGGGSDAGRGAAATPSAAPLGPSASGSSTTGTRDAYPREGDGFARKTSPHDPGAWAMDQQVEISRGATPDSGATGEETSEDTVGDGRKTLEDPPEEGKEPCENAPAPSAALTKQP